MTRAQSLTDSLSVNFLAITRRNSVLGTMDWEGGSMNFALQAGQKSASLSDDPIITR